MTTKSTASYCWDETEIGCKVNVNYFDDDKRTTEDEYNEM